MPTRKTDGSAPIAIIQARFGSRRFPGKVLADFRGKKVLEHVLQAAGDSCGKDRLILATSNETQDDAVAKFASDTNRKVYRGSLGNVWSRFQQVALSTEVEGINRYAVPAEPRSRIEWHKAKWLGLGRIDNFPDIDSHGAVDHLKLVHQSDID